MKNLRLFSVFAFALFVTVNIYGQYKAGDAVADFKLLNVDGSYTSLSQYHDVKGFILIFTCNTCPVAKKYEDRIISLDREFKSKGYPVIAISSNDKKINPGDSYEEMQKYSKKRNFTFPYLYDESQEIARRFGATNTPHVYIVSAKNGKYTVEYTGAIDNNVEDAAEADKRYVFSAVQSLLKGEQPEPRKTVAVGCGIKWRKT